VGLPADFAPTAAAETGPQLAARALASGAFVAIPHPEWYGLTQADAATIVNAHAVEVYNHTSHIHAGRGGGSYFLDEMLIAGRRINALACDDAHFNISADENRDAFGGWVKVKSGANDASALVEALKAGHYYSSQGPDILAMTRDGSELVVETSPSHQILLAGPNSLSVQASGTAMTEARLSLERFAGKWSRLIVVDETGRLAWSNPMWF
jgi:hypothetical protein